MNRISARNHACGLGWRDPLKGFFSMQSLCLVPYITNARKEAVAVMNKLIVLLWGLSVTPFAPADRLVDDPAAGQIQTLDAALLKSMRAGATLGINARYRMLEPVIELVFDIPLMTRLSIGPAWPKFTPEQQAAAVASFSRLTIASYAHNFHDFNGEAFAVDNTVLSRGGDKVVRATITPKHDQPAGLAYRMRQLNGSWKIIDVAYDGVSELSLRRVDFSVAIAAGGPPALIGHLTKLSDDLMKP